MGEVSGIFKFGLLLVVIVVFGALVAGFYFSVTSPVGRQGFIGIVENLLSSFWGFVESPFNGMSHAITNFFNNLNL